LLGWRADLRGGRGFPPPAGGYAGMTNREVDYGQEVEMINAIPLTPFIRGARPHPTLSFVRRGDKPP